MISCASVHTGLVVKRFSYVIRLGSPCGVKSCDRVFTHISLTVEIGPSNKAKWRPSGDTEGAR